MANKYRDSQGKFTTAEKSVVQPGTRKVAPINVTIVPKPTKGKAQ